MSKDRTWFIKCEKNGKHVLTMFDDGYVFNEKVRNYLFCRKMHLIKLEI